LVTFALAYILRGRLFSREEVKPFLDFEEMLDDDIASLAWEKELGMEIVV
jgi:hypothetical protein